MPFKPYFSLSYLCAGPLPVESYFYLPGMKKTVLISLLLILTLAASSQFVFQTEFRHGPVVVNKSFAYNTCWRTGAILNSLLLILMASDLLGNLKYIGEKPMVHGGPRMSGISFTPWKRLNRESIPYRGHGLVPEINLKKLRILW